jgi:hypothetical protein
MLALRGIRTLSAQLQPLGSIVVLLKSNHGSLNLKARDSRRLSLLRDWVFILFRWIAGKSFDTLTGVERTFTFKEPPFLLT